MKKSKYLVFTALSALVLSGCPAPTPTPEPEPTPTPTPTPVVKEWSAEVKAAMTEVLGFELPYIELANQKMDEIDGGYAVEGDFDAEKGEAYKTTLEAFAAEKGFAADEIESLSAVQYFKTANYSDEISNGTKTYIFGFESFEGETESYNEVYFRTELDITYTDWTAEQKAAMLEAYDVVLPFIDGVADPEFEVVDEDESFYYTNMTESQDEASAFVEAYVGKFGEEWAKAPVSMSDSSGNVYSGYALTRSTDFVTQFFEDGLEYPLDMQVLVASIDYYGAGLYFIEYINGGLTAAQVEVEAWPADVIDDLYMMEVPAFEGATSFVYQPYYGTYGMCLDLLAIGEELTADAYLAKLAADHYGIEEYEGRYYATSWDGAIEIEVYATEQGVMLSFADYDGDYVKDFIEDFDELEDIYKVLLKQVPQVLIDSVVYPAEELIDPKYEILVEPFQNIDSDAFLAALADTEAGAEDAYYLDMYMNYYSMSFAEVWDYFMQKEEATGNQGKWLAASTIELYNSMLKVYGVTLHMVAADDSFSETYYAALEEAGYINLGGTMFGYNPDPEWEAEDVVYIGYEVNAETKEVIWQIDFEYVIPEPVLTGIELSGEYKTEFTLGDEFDYQGLVVTASYDIAESKEVEGFVVSTPDMSEVGEKEVTVSYTEGEVTKTATYTITVSEEVVPPTPVEPTTIEVTMGDYATAHEWANAEQHLSFKLDEVVTVSTTEGTNNGKFYNTANPNEWRLYHSENGVVTISVGEGYVIDSVTITYKSNNGGYLADSAEAKVDSGSAYEVNATSVAFTVLGGNNDTASNGQARVQAISVTYHAVAA